MNAWMRSVVFLAMWFVLVLTGAAFVTAFVGREHCPPDAHAERRGMCDRADAEAADPGSRAGADNPAAGPQALNTTVPADSSP